jgi:ribosomal protein L22
MSAADEQGPEETVAETKSTEGEPQATEKPAAKAKPKQETAAKPAAKTDGESAPKAKKAAAKAKAAKPAAAEQAAGGEPAEEQPAAKQAPAKKAAAKAAKKGSEQAEPPAAPAKPSAAKKDGSPVRRSTVRAHARYVRTSARKARMVCGHLRGKSVQEARAILAFTPRDVARDWSKLLESAVANAENNHELLEDDLIVREAYADEGPTIKRFRPRAMGRATPIRKRTSHLTITLTPRP